MTQSTNLLNTFWYGDKTAELALFYNLAADRIIDYIKKEHGNNNPEDKIKKAPKWEDTGFVDALAIKLKNYLWKGYTGDRNSSGTGITHDEKETILKVLKLLFHVRDYQSHYYHDNSVLKLDEHLRSFFIKKFDGAKNALREKYPYDLDKYEKEFQKHKENVEEKRKKKGDEEFQLFEIYSKVKNENWLIKDGKVFFLSFFLTTGEMKRFLKQRKGFKRDDKDNFRVKHHIFSHYCHRDGAARFHYNQDETFLSSHDGILEEILKKRQIYKLITYLNNQSPVTNDPSVFSLEIKDANGTSPKKLSVKQLTDFTVTTSLFSGLRPKAVEVRFKDVYNEEQTKDSTSQIDLSLDNTTIRLSRNTFHRMLVDAIRIDEDGIVNTLKKYVDERKKVINTVRETRQYNPLDSFLNECETFRLRTKNEKVIREFCRWRKEPDGENKQHETYRSRIKEMLEQQPIELRYIDLFFEEDRSLRTKDQFIRLAVQYLIDHNVEPNLQWQWQRFDVIGKKGKQVLAEVKQFSSVKPSGVGHSDWRLKLTHDNQILFKYQDKLFFIGHKAMKNLLVAHLVDEEPLNSFFNCLKSELDALKENKPTALLEPAHVPSYLKNKTPDNSAIRAATKKRIESLHATFSQLSKVEMTRDQKNRQIMRWYRLFEWGKRPSGVELFLRRDEYKKLSIYHYLLEKSGSHHEMIRDTILAEVKEVNRLPGQVLELLKGSNSLDDLFEKTKSKVIKLLESHKGAVENTEVQIKHIKPIARKIGIPLYKNQDSKDHVPFDIHPILVLNYFYKDKMTIGKFSLSKKLREDQHVLDQLRAENYEYEKYLTHFPELSKSSRRKIVGAMNELKTYDILLYKIAKKYDETAPRVHDMRNEYTEFCKGTAKYISTDIQWKIYVKYHQLDDIVTSLNENKIKAIVTYIFNKAEKEEKLPGSIQQQDGYYRVPFEEIKKVRDEVSHESLGLIKKIFEFEKRVIEKNPAESHTKATEANGSARLGFNEILELHRDATNENKILRYRNKALHTDIPDGYTFKDALGHPFFQ